MKLASILIISIFNLIFCTSIKATPIRKGLAKHSEKDYTLKGILNDGAESSVNPQSQKDKEELNSKLKNTENDTDNGGDKMVNKSEYHKEYYQKNKEYFQNYKKVNKEKVNENQRNYYKRNKESIIKARQQYMKIYHQKNKEKIRESQKIYYQNNKEKLNANRRKYRQNKKNNQSDINEGTSFVNPQTGDFTSRGKLPIVCEEEGNPNQEEEELNNGEDEQNQIEAEEPNKILDNDTINSNKKTLPFDLNEKPDVEELEDY